MTYNELSDQLIERLNEAAEGAIDVRDVRSRFSVTVDDGLAGAAIDVALAYTEGLGQEGRDFFGPIFETDQGAEPPAPSELSADFATVWESVGSRVTSPILKARLHDLCFVVRRGNGRDHVRTAGEAYLELAKRYPSSDEDRMTRLHVALNATHYVARTIDLARSTGQDDLAEAAIEVGMDLAQKAQSDSDAGPGVVFGFLRPVVRDRACPGAVDDLLSRARLNYRDDVWNTMSAIGLQLERRGLDASDREMLYRQQVQALIDAAAASEPLNAMLHLQNAVELAERHGLEDLRGEATKRLQDLRGADLGMKRHEVSFNLDREIVDRWINDLLGEPSWQEAIRGLLFTGPPTGQVEENRTMAAEMRELTPLQTMMPTLHIGPDGLPISSSEGDDPEAALVNLELQKLQILGPLRAMALGEILKKWGPIDLDDAAAFFGRGENVPDAVARAIGRALNRHRAGDFEGATFSALPRVERLVREILLALGVPVYKPPTNGVPARFAGLGTMLGSL
jgi:hypothetical protein